MLLKLAPAALMVLSACCVYGAASSHPRVVLLESFRSSGSGVVIADGWILTAAHNLPKDTADGLPLGEPIRHPFLDLALVPCAGLVGNIVIAETMPELHDPLSAYGYWLGFQLQRTDGYQSHRPGLMSAAIIPGCSGGAVVNERGELVGIILHIGFIGVQDRATGTYSNERGTVVPQVAGYAPLTDDVVGWIIRNT